MDFIHTIKQEEVALELKYCERCGGLWLRPQGNEGVLCEGCHRQLAELMLPTPRTHERRARRKSIKSQAQVVCLFGVSELEVRL